AAEQLLAADARCAETGAVEGVPEGDGLEPAGRGARDLERHLDRIRTAGGKQGLGERPGRDRRELLGELDRRRASEAPGREGQLVELAPDRLDQARMAVADVVGVVAVEIHVAAAVGVLEPDAFRLA